MQYSDLFPPGEIFWLVEKDDLILPQDLPGSITGPRLFKVRLLSRTFVVVIT